MFAAWDRFEHDMAFERLSAYTPLQGTADYVRTLSFLTADCVQREPLRIMDLWLNARRRAAQGRYDDAVARVYRLLEWTAQWLLRERCGIDTADIPPEQVDEASDLTVGRDGRSKAGLFVAWQLIEKKLPDSAAASFVRQYAHEMLDHLQLRNQSILAHGFTPIGQRDWLALQEWLEQRFIGVLLRETKASRVKKMPPQLPARYLWHDR